MIKSWQSSRFGLLVAVVTGLAILGSILLAQSHAATPALSVQPENGTKTGNATVMTDTSASAGKAVAFDSSVTPPPPPPPPPTGSLKVYFGSTHNHTGCCNNHGSDNSTVQQVFATAKAHGFDFLISTEHSGHSGPISQGIQPQVFYADVKAQAAHYTDATFVGLAGYEFSDNDKTGPIGKGHMTGVETDDFLSADGAADAKTLEDYLVAQRNAGRPAFGGFNHPSSGGHPGSAPALLTPARRNVIVMSEIHNSYESGADQSHYQGWVSALDRGWRLGPTCGLDGHGLFRISDTTQPGPCRVGVLAPSLTKANIIDGFMNRRIYSSRDINLNVQYKVNGQWMGSIIGTPTTLNFDINVSDPDTGRAADSIKKIEILTQGGSVVTSKTFDSHQVSWQPSIPANGKKYYFIRVFDGERSGYTAAAAPVFLEQQ